MFGPEEASLSLLQIPKALGEEDLILAASPGVHTFNWCREVLLGLGVFEVSKSRGSLLLPDARSDRVKVFPTHAGLEIGNFD